MLLVRVIIGKVENNERLVNVLRTTPIRQGDSSWNYVGWVKEALEGLKADGQALGTCVIEWNSVRDGAMTYCQRKKDEHRFDGEGNFDMGRLRPMTLSKGKRKPYKRRFIYLPELAQVLTNNLLINLSQKSPKYL